MYPDEDDILDCDDNFDENNELIDELSNRNNLTKQNISRRQVKTKINTKQRKFLKKQKKRFIKKIIKESTTIDELNIVQINAFSAVNKLNEVEALAQFAHAHVIGITETFFADDMTYLLVNYECFVSMPSNNKNFARGGAAIYIRKDVAQNFQKINIKEKNSMNAQIVGVSSHEFNLCIFLCYRSPSQKSDDEIEEFMQDVKALNLDEIDEWLFMGDLNMPTAWGPGRIKNGNRCSGPYLPIYEYFDELDTTQPIDEATHKSGNTLDVFICSWLIDIDQSRVLKNYVFDSDHKPVSLTVKLSKKLKKSNVNLEKLVMDLSKADLEGYRLELLNKKPLLCDIANTIIDGVCTLDVNLAAERLGEELVKIWKQFVPYKKITIQNKAHSRETREQIVKLQKLNRHFDRKSQEIRTESKKLTKMLKQDRKDKARDRLDKIVADGKHIYTYFKRSRQGESRIGPFWNPATGKLTTSDQEAADVLNTHYTSVWHKDSSINIDPHTPPMISMGGWWHPPMTDIFNYEGSIDISDDAVFNSIFKVKRKVAQGPDFVNGRMLKEAPEILTEPFAILLRNMVHFCTWPDVYKIANVTPLKKSGDSRDPNNTRPISVSSIIGKVFERVVCWRLLKHIKYFNGGKFDIATTQFGFFNGRSVNDNLTMSINKMACIIASGKSAEICLLDLRKGFDVCKFSDLARCLKNSGVLGKGLQLWKSWMTNRRQRVKFNEVSSEFVNISSGVCQGTSSGPNLFLCYINPALRPEMGVNNKLKRDNTMEERFGESAKDKRSRLIKTTSTYSFADDTKLISASENHAELQENLDNLQRWADENGMTFSVGKCVVLYLAPKNMVNPKHPYYLYGQKIQEAENVRDLGLFYCHKNGQFDFTTTLKKRIRICNTVFKISRNIVSNRVETIDQYIFMYNTYVLPQLTTFSEHYFLETEKECELVDEVYKSFFSNLSFSVAGLKSFPYAPSAFLKKLARIRFYRLVLGLGGCDPHDLFNFIGGEENPRARLQYPRIKNRETRDEAIRKNFCWRMINFWNKECPDSYKSLKCNNFDKFKNWVSSQEYVLGTLHTAKARALREDLMNGKYATVLKRRRGYVQAGREIKSQKLRDAYDDSIALLQPVRDQYHNYAPVPGRGLYTVKSPSQPIDGAAIQPIDGASIAARGAVVNKERQTGKTGNTTKAGDAPKSTSQSRKSESDQDQFEKEINGVTVKLALQSFEDPLQDLEDDVQSQENLQNIVNVQNSPRRNDEIPGKKLKRPRGGRRINVVQDHSVSFSDIMED